MTHLLGMLRAGPVTRSSTMSARRLWHPQAGSRLHLSLLGRPDSASWRCLQDAPALRRHVCSVAATHRKSPPEHADPSADAPSGSAVSVSAALPLELVDVLEEQEAVVSSLEDESRQLPRRVVINVSQQRPSQLVAFAAPARHQCSSC